MTGATAVPRVSVVIATYDASFVLRHAVASVLCQELTDFELIVVGDHCTDDSEEVVASFGDPRVRFINLPTNSGQQATPNNVGVAAARGRFIAFLNHDDMYLPHHLSSGIARLERTGADVLCVSHATIPAGRVEELESGDLGAMGDGFEPTGRFSPTTFHVASSWILTREAARRVGPWKLEKETWVTPSQEWLFRAWRRGCRIEWTREISLVAIFSGGRRDFYRKRDDREHAFVFRNVVASDRLRARLVASAQEWIDEKLRPRRSAKPWPRRLERGLRRARDRAVARVLLACGLHPNTVQIMRKWGWRRGALVRSRKQLTG